MMATSWVASRTIAGTEVNDLIQFNGDLAKIPSEITIQIQRDALYSHYIGRQANDVSALRRDSERKIPLDISYEGIIGLSNELRAKLIAANPDNMAQAARIEGITPAALMLLLGEIKKLDVSAKVS